METSQEAAVAAITAAEAAGNVAAALVVFDALDQHRDALTTFDRYDFAFAAWQRLVDVEAPIRDEDIVGLVIRVAGHVPEHTVVDFVDSLFGIERERRIRLEDGRGLEWLPADEVVILSWPLGGGIADVMCARRRRA